MATNLYEELDLPKDATADQIRKAYKKKALKTHPDRLSPNATPEEKAASEEHFRKVNNAYEVLTDPQKRKEYDRYGVWPPPDLDDDEPLPRRPSGNRRGSFSRHPPTPRSPFGDHFFSHPFPSATFTDPFTLFDSIFGDFPFQSHSRPSPYRPHRSRSDDPFQMPHRMHQEMMGSMFAQFEREMFSTFPDHHNVGFVPPVPRLPAPSSSNQRWVEESFVTSTVNGVTQTVHKRRDWDGNEHVTRTFPDGREVFTINGEQQSSHRGYLEPPVIPRPPPAGPPPPYQGRNTNYNPFHNAYPMNTNTDYHRRGGW
ncbi:uncharacterized protein LACBIDRAFT_321834 [Laccaria bicolor S238N-H82]|uniref:Predicted protein n=1 Tax=Laccaria bicolor (strain S238N-H82 / ATCC MYA-4686) TaxID=486041 RepID=B0CUA8_LACBS|nr:uncharacterized protein LACBIDRAFT_321834 [Laccaria bicolor S238N-H82]EDR14063.1 predicted protein [Laccaria bicolor S238N-H82]|eukprot:XP_001874622.1 predicted protein [Laccaria bicolor S238N-H82]